MASDHTGILVVGGGAAGIAAARRVAQAGVECRLVEARPRLGGRAWTWSEGLPFALDLGCAWLHSAEDNPWAAIAEQEGFALDRKPAPWARPALPIGFPLARQAAYFAAMAAFQERLHAAAPNGDRAADRCLDPQSEWNGLIGAVMTWISGAEPDRLSIVDLDRYADSGVNWQVAGGFGTAIAAHAKGLEVVLDCPVTSIDRSGPTLLAETAKGGIAADAVIVTLSTDILAEEGLRFSPALPEKRDAAAGLPLGLADKLYLHFSGAEEFEPDSRVFGRSDRTETAAYHLRPSGRPLIEAYFGGRLAAALEAGGEAAFVDFAVAELCGLFGASFAARLRPIRATAWGLDPFARGSYSYALPGRADDRAVLAAPVEDRLFFAGEACSRNDFSTAHGAYRTGIAAADAAVAALRRRQGRATS